ncbi:MAG TPA: hypothetical protein VHO69_04670, partial [Phototrophicaceae bacterium]|nr:hypothetical protein [Phototrophicaceae bacterium]
MNHKTKKLLSLWRHSTPGQALVEYALILTLVAMALMAALIATGPAIANVFSNTVCNLVGLEDCSPDSVADNGGAPGDFWKTVTAVATNPPRETPNKLNPELPEKTIDPNQTPFTATPVTPSATPRPTDVDTLTPTPTDQNFLMPHLDSINTPAWWRVDSSVYLGGADWWGEYFPNKTLTGPAEPAALTPLGKAGRWNYQIDPKYKFNINFDWGDGAPLGGWQTDNFSARWTREITVAGTDNVDVSITITSIGGVRLL